MTQRRRYARNAEQILHDHGCCCCSPEGPNSSLAVSNFSVTIPQASMRSFKPLRRASNAVVLRSSASVSSASSNGRRKDRCTPCLDSNAHLSLAGMWYGIATEFDIRTVHCVSTRSGILSPGSPYFLHMKYRRALPRVWSSFSTENDAA